MYFVTNQLHFLFFDPRFHLKNVIKVYFEVNLCQILKFFHKFFPLSYLVQTDIMI